MSDTLRDQLLGLGFKPAPKPEKPAKPGQPQGTGKGRPGDRTRGEGQRRGPDVWARSRDERKPQPRPQRGPREDIDLAKAYAIRAQREKDERIAAERAKQEEARRRREAKARLAGLLKDRALNDAQAELVRHFDYGGKIKRIYVTPDQLRALNAGELGVVQLDGRYLLVTAALLAEAEAIFAPAIALKVDPDAPAADDPYADPRYQVPDDLVW